MQTINKQAALARLTSLEKEAKELRAIIDAPVKITDRIKTYKDACEVLGISPKQVQYDNNDSDADLVSIVAYGKLVHIAHALNEGWQPDWANSNERKYVPFFKNKPGFGLAYDVYGNWSTATCVGSRLCYKTAELAEYAATQFADLYNDFLTIK